MKEITLTRGKTAMVDDDDYERLNSLSWACYYNRSGNWYVHRGKNKTSPYTRMHHMVLEDFREIDHINGNGLDNRKDNLRVVTRFQNSGNRVGRKGRTTKGVALTSVGRYRAYIRVDGKQKHLGVYSNPVEAQKAYDVAAKEVWGEYATTAEDLQRRAKAA